MTKKEEYKYYSTQRPVDIGTYPKSRENPMIGFTNYDSTVTSSPPTGRREHP